MPESILLREAVDYTPVAVASANVRLQRTFEKNLWNTLCVPVDIDSPSSVFGADTKVARLEGFDGTTVLFSSTETIEANVPYLIAVGKVNSNSGVADSASLQSIYSISDVALKEPGANGLTDSKVGIDMIGSYQDGNIVAGDHNFVLATDQLTLIDNGDEVATGRFRAYFHVPGTTAENLEIAVDGIITGIRLTTTKQAVNKATYSLQGVKMEQGKRLKKGVYIRDNQKVIVR
jgi:hypothetical protein